MVSDSEKQALRDDVEMFLQTKYNIEPQRVIHITNPILDIWFDELSTECSYFTADNIADIIVDIYTQYYKYN